jgi:hypothetical protein
LIYQGQVLIEGPRDEVLKKLSTGVRKKPMTVKPSRSSAQTAAETAIPNPPMAPAAV